MFRKKVSKEEVEYSNIGNEDPIDFDWTDIFAFIIAFFQVLSPYVAGVVGAYFIVALLLNLWIR